MSGWYRTFSLFLILIIDFTGDLEDQVTSLSRIRMCLFSEQPIRSGRNLLRPELLFDEHFLFFPFLKAPVKLSTAVINPKCDARSKEVKRVKY